MQRVNETIGSPSRNMFRMRDLSKRHLSEFAISNLVCFLY